MNRRLRLGRIQIYLEPRDVWVGVYVAPDAVYVCPLPLVVVRWSRQDGGPVKEMNVRGLAKLLNEHVACGHGDDDVYTVLHDGDDTQPDGVIDTIGRTDWAITGFGWAGEQDAFVYVVAEPDTGGDR